MNFSPFSHKLIKKALKFKRPFSIEELGENDIDTEELLDNSEFFFCNYDNCGTRTYISKINFFEDSKFTVHFAFEEIHKRILTAPLRFLPFTVEALPLFVENVEIKQIEIKPGIKCLEEVYHIDHGQLLIKYLNESSEKTLVNLNSLINETLPVYDFSAYKLEPGDHLQIRVKNGFLKAEILKSEDIDLQKAQSWCEQFEKSLLSVLREFGPFNGFSRQIEFAYFYGSQTLRKEGPIALRDFFTLSKKVELVDFVFQKIIWFKGDNPENSPEALRRLASLKESIRTKILVCDSFYSVLDEELQSEFVSPGIKLVCCNDIGEVYKKLQKGVRRVALWIKNHRGVFLDDTMPANEILMFGAAFTEFQFLCAYYLEHKNSTGFEENFSEALEFNFEILSELMDFLREYYHSI